LWDVDARKKLAELNLRVAVPRFASFSPDGRRGVSPAMDGSAKVWDARTGEMLPPLRHKGVVLRAVFSPDGRVIATASRDFEARLWDAQTGRALTAPLVHRSTVNHVRFTADSRRLVTITRDWAVRVWDVESGLPLTNPLPFSLIGLDEGLALTPDGQTVAVVGRNRTVQLWSVPEPPGPIPEWLIEAAEALAGFQQDDEGISTAIPVERLHALIGQIQSSTATDDFTRWAKTVFELNRSKQR
jgi:eukaryotic-like serine/threonine-protein kinase